MPVRRSFRGVSFSCPMAPSASSCLSPRFSLSLGISFRPASCSISIFWLPHRFSVSVGFFRGFFFFFFFFYQVSQDEFQKRKTFEGIFPFEPFDREAWDSRITKLRIYETWNLRTVVLSNVCTFELLQLRILAS